MSQFQPASTALIQSVYGDATTSSSTSGTEEGSDWTEYMPYAKAIQELFFSSDPRVEAAETRAKLKNLETQYKATSSSFLKGLYLNQIVKLKAKLKVLEQQAVEEKQSVQIVQTGKVAGVVLASVGIGATLAVTYYFIQKAKTEKALRLRPAGV